MEPKDRSSRMVTVIVIILLIAIPLIANAVAGFDAAVKCVSLYSGLAFLYLMWYLLVRIRNHWRK